MCDYSHECNATCTHRTYSFKFLVSVLTKILLVVFLGGVSLTLRHRLDCKVMTKDKIDQYHGEMCPIEADEFLAPTVTSKFSALSLNHPTVIPTTTDRETESAHHLVS